jgi:RNA polymerase sigma-70 factor (ECF subfamily)
MRADDSRSLGFRALYEDHVDDVARYSARRTQESEVHDVVSETFLVAWRRFDDVPSDALPWLLATARRVIANRRRSTGRRRALDEKLVNEATTGSREADVDGVDETVAAAIAELPDAEREAFMLVAWDGLDPLRASQAAGCAPGTFRMRLHRARGHLRSRLATAPPAPTGSRTSLEDHR